MHAQSARAGTRHRQQLLLFYKSNPKPECPRLGRPRCKAASIEPPDGLGSSPGITASFLTATASHLPARAATWWICTSSGTLLSDTKPSSPR